MVARPHSLWQGVNLQEVSGWRAQSVENVGVRLTSGFLLEPAQSTSAIVVHHPGAKYFVV
jgi:5-methyltetrahydrofolate--homocysteine methyltransferase